MVVTATKTKQTVCSATTFHVGGTPRFVVTGLYPSLLNLTPQQASVLSVIVNSSHYIAAGAIILVTILLVWRERRLRAKRPT